MSTEIWIVQKGFCCNAWLIFCISELKLYMWTHKLVFCMQKPSESNQTRKRRVEGLWNYLEGKQWKKKTTKKKKPSNSSWSTICWWESENPDWHQQTRLLDLRSGCCGENKTEVNADIKVASKSVLVKEWV